MGYNFSFEYKKRVENKVADALFRTYEDLVAEGPINCHVVTCIRSLWVNEVASSYCGDDEVNKLISKVLLTPTQAPDFTFIEGLMRYKGRLVVGKSNGIQIKILATLHSSAIEGHLGVQSSYQRAKSLFH